MQFNRRGKFIPKSSKDLEEEPTDTLSQTGPWF